MNDNFFKNLTRVLVDSTLLVLFIGMLIMPISALSLATYSSTTGDVLGAAVQPGSASVKVKVRPNYSRNSKAIPTPASQEKVTSPQSNTRTYQVPVKNSTPSVR